MSLQSFIEAGFARLTAAINAVDAKTGGAGGGSSASGRAVIDFGVHPGKSIATLAINGQDAIVATSKVDAWIVAEPTADHSADEHVVDPPKLTVGEIIPGTGFTIFATSASPSRGQLPTLNRGQRKTARTSLPYGKWSIVWRWQ